MIELFKLLNVPDVFMIFDLIDEFLPTLLILTEKIILLSLAFLSTEYCEALNC